MRLADFLPTLIAFREAIAGLDFCLRSHSFPRQDCLNILETLENNHDANIGINAIKQRYGKNDRAKMSISQLVDFRDYLKALRAKSE